MEEKWSEVVKEEWLKMVSGSAEAVEDFNEFLDDRAILWAASRIKELEKELSSALSEKSAYRSKDRKELLAEYLYQLHMDEGTALTVNGGSCI